MYFKVQLVWRKKKLKKIKLKNGIEQKEQRTSARILRLQILYYYGSIIELSELMVSVYVCPVFLRVTYILCVCVRVWEK